MFVVAYPKTYEMYCALVIVHLSDNLEIPLLNSHASLLVYVMRYWYSAISKEAENMSFNSKLFVFQLHTYFAVLLPNKMRVTYWTKIESHTHSICSTERPVLLLPYPLRNFDCSPYPILVIEIIICHSAETRGHDISVLVYIITD